MNKTIDDFMSNGATQTRLQIAEPFLVEESKIKNMVIEPFSTEGS